ncbi:MAG: 23S rRNA (pseudouridine(1915)-N(3))-methyltransferase RlmH [Burkholderiales bacterium]|nr:23S rRNA (pseudouridine(1915)-N(3))-methyltransferase RlmH [Burkholderiales bacterium]
MKLRIVTLGQRTPAWVDAGIATYVKRLPREYALTILPIRPEPRNGGKTIEQVLAAEAARLRTACAGCRVIALDERGAAWTTRDLADRIGRWRDAAIEPAFVIGSADGLDAAFKRDAHDRVALSAMTLPHGLVRIIVAEQIYRAVAIATGHPYHRE